MKDEQELKRQIAALGHDHQVALDLILSAIEEAQGDRARYAALEEKLAPWFLWPVVSYRRVLVDLIAEWRAETEPMPIGETREEEAEAPIVAGAQGAEVRA